MGPPNCLCWANTDVTKPGTDPVQFVGGSKDAPIIETNGSLQRACTRIAGRAIATSRPCPQGARSEPPGCSLAVSSRPQVQGAVRRRRPLPEQWIRNIDRHPDRVSDEDGIRPRYLRVKYERRIPVSYTHLTLPTNTEV